MSTSTFRILWIIWAAVGLILEFAALISRQEGATLSANIWSLRGTGFFSLIIFFLLWLIYHFLLEGRIG